MGSRVRVPSAPQEAIRKGCFFCYSITYSQAPTQKFEERVHTKFHTTFLGHFAQLTLQKHEKHVIKHIFYAKYLVGI